MIYRFAHLYSGYPRDAWCYIRSWTLVNVEAMGGLDVAIAAYAQELHDDGANVTHVKATPVNDAYDIVGDAVYYRIKIAVAVERQIGPP